MNTSTSNTGIPWSEQELSDSPMTSLESFRKWAIGRIETGHLNRADLDHNSPNYPGFGNKQVSILAAKLEPACKDLSWDDKWKVVIRAAFPR